ncbi:MAG: MATE family efflux transporter [Oscillospiraceae bacterium]
MNKNEKALEGFSSGKISTAVFRNAIPAMAAMLMVLIYNLADTFFIGRTHDDLQVAAVSLATPVFLLFMATGTIFGIGGTSVISRAMGQGRKDYARRVSAFCMWACVAVGVVMSLLFWLLMDPILTLVGASADTWDYAKSYLNIVTACGPFVLIANCYSNVLRAEGQSAKAMMGMLIGNLLNVILDPIMILWLGWDIQGAAIATVIGNLVGALYYILYFLKGGSMLSIHPRDFTLRGGVCTGVLAIGIPASLGSLMMSVSQIVMNSQMTRYGDMAVAGIGVAMKVTMMTGMVCIGLGQGVQPLLGYCVGARNWDRYKKVLRFSLVFALLLGAALTGVCYLFTEQIVRAFLTDADALDFGVRFSRILLSTSALFGVFYVLTNALQAMGAATPSLIINLSRQGLIYIPALFLLEAALGVTGLIWAQPVADVLSLLLAVALYVPRYRKMLREAGQPIGE